MQMIITRFGFGEIADRSFGAGRAMGGVGIGLRSPEQINPMNPASYSCMDSLTFIFDFGASMKASSFKDQSNQYNHLLLHQLDLQKHYMYYHLHTNLFV